MSELTEKIPGKKKEVLALKRFSISFSEDEYKRLEAILAWYEETVGVRVSRCAIIKQLLFAEYSDAFAKSDI